MSAAASEVAASRGARGAQGHGGLDLAAGSQALLSVLAPPTLLHPPATAPLPPPRPPQSLSIELDAVPRCFHCAANMELPSPARRRARFSRLPALSRALTPTAAARITALWLDAFPDDPREWGGLAELPSLRALVTGRRAQGRGATPPPLGHGALVAPQVADTPAHLLADA